MPASKARLNQPLELIQPLGGDGDDPEEVERAGEREHPFTRVRCVWVDAVSPEPTVTVWLPPTMMSKPAATLITSRIEIEPVSVRRNEFGAIAMPASVRVESDVLSFSLPAAWILMMSKTLTSIETSSDERRCRRCRSPAPPAACTSSRPARCIVTSNWITKAPLVIEMSTKPDAVARPRKLTEPSMCRWKPLGTTAPVVGSVFAWLDGVQVDERRRVERRARCCLRTHLRRRSRPRCARSGRRSRSGPRPRRGPGRRRAASSSR